MEAEQGSFQEKFALQGSSPTEQGWFCKEAQGEIMRHLCKFRALKVGLVHHVDLWMRSDRSQSTSWINFPIVLSRGRSMPMSTSPVLLGRVTGVNSGNSQKDEDQPGDEGVDIEGLPNQPVGQENDEGRPSWTWRGFQGFIALLVVICSTCLALALGSRESWVYHTNLSVKVPICDSSYKWQNTGSCIETDWIEKGLATDPSFYALIVSTGLAGLAAMWLYLIAPTAHTLFAAHFLCLNWLEGLSLLAVLKEWQIRVFLGLTLARGGEHHFSSQLWGCSSCWASLLDCNWSFSIACRVFGQHWTDPAANCGWVGACGLKLPVISAS